MSIEQIFERIATALESLVLWKSEEESSDPAAPKPRGRKPKNTTDSTQPVTPSGSAATAPAATSGVVPAASSTVTVTADPGLLVKATEAVIKLANEYSRDAAVGILGKYKVNRCSDLKPEEWSTVLTEATNAIQAAEAAKTAATSNASLV